MKLRSAHWTAPAFLVILIALLAAMLFYPDAGTAAPVMTTDKADYYAAETVTVTGSGFAPNTQYDIPVIRPDGSLVKGDGTLTPGWDTVTSNGSGGFTYLYKLDGIFGSYEVRAYPVSWSGNLADGPLTSVTFTDADIHFSQCANDDNGDNAPQACKWVEGALNTNNSIYTEGDAVPHRLFHKLTDVGAYQFEFEYDYSKASIYAYDFLTSADQGPQDTLALLNPCADKPAFASACSTITNSLYTGATPVAIASDPFDAVPGAEAAVATREMKVGCSGPGACSALAVFFPSGNGGDDPGENHVPDTDPDCTNTGAPRCGTASVKIRLSVTTPAGTSNSSPTLVAIWFGGHVSFEGYWGTTGCGTGGTDACGASSISGAPFHMQYKCLDEPDSPDGGCESVGNRDNQLSASTVTAGDIIITKDVITQSGTHPQDFSFSCSPTLGAFTLDDDGANGNPLDSSRTFSTVPAATYTCTESAPSSGWALTGLTCSDPDGGTTVNVGTRTATIDLDNGETISCTYTNTATGTINIVKDAVPNDAQDFSFTCTSPLGGFSLDDDANGTLSNTQTFSGTLAGSYSCTETAPPSPWNLSSISCSDPDTGTTTNVGTRTATIDLDPGETITCTFTNDSSGNITIIKDTDPNDPQDFCFNGDLPDVNGGGTGDFCLDDDGNGTLSNTHTTTRPTGATYNVTELGPTPGFDLISISCTGDLDGGTTTNVGAATASIELDPGEDITCKFTNQKDSQIVVCKETDPNGDPAVFDFSASWDTGPDPDFALADGNCDNSGDLDPGTYSVSETVPSGWDLASVLCVSSIGDSEVPASIELDAGETVTCTFNNEKDANILVCKETDPDGSGQPFEFDPSYSASNFFLTDGLCDDSGDLDPGTYSVSETATPGWVLSSSSCSDGSSIAAISLSAGETVTCTFNNTKTGSITIVKDADPNGTQGFFFTCSAPIGPFTLDDDGTSTPFDSTKTTSGLLPGTYSCSEALPAGWVLTSATCSDGSSPASISLSAGENVTCTFVNTLPGSITIVKDAVPNSVQSFSFTCSAPIGSFTLDDDGANDNPLDNSKTQASLLPGSYSCSETVPGAWALTGISCAGDTDGGSVVTIPGVNIDLDAGENITCTFTNTQGSITIIKDTVPNGPQDFCFNGALPDANGAGTGDFCLDDDVEGTLSNSHPVSVAPGTYAVNELGPTAGFDLTAITCPDPDSGTTVNLGTATATIDLDAGESITCTFTNTQRGHILVDKVTAPAASSQSFEFDPSYGANFFLTDAAAANDSGALVPGTYSVAEVNIPAEWDLTSALCSDGSSPASIALAAGETVTCTFTDTQRGHIIICKETDPDGSSQSFGFDPSYGSNFFDTDGLPCNDSGPLVAGSYTVTEVNIPLAWNLVNILCVDPDNGSSPSPPTANVDLDPGETVTCTFNDKINTATFNVAKDFVPDHPASPDPDVTISLFCTGGTVTPTDPTANEQAGDTANFTVTGFVPPTSCSATEPTTPAGYTKDESACLAIPITVGGTSSCTITNEINVARFTVYKDFSDKSATDTTTVSVTLSCVAGTITLPNPKPASEATPAVFDVTGLASSTTCTASEGTPPVGYTASGCTTPVTLPATGIASCTITNTLNTAYFKVAKDFFPDHPASPDPDVTMNLTCNSGGNVTPTDPTANEEAADTADFTVTGFTPPATCTATETTPAGYVKDESACVAVPITIGGTSSCTITNTGPATFNVAKNFVPDYPGPDPNVTINLTCTSGTVLAPDPTANEEQPDTANFTITGLTMAATCTATEPTTPAGYTKDESACQAIPIALGGVSSCVITNTIAAPTPTPPPPVGGVVSISTGDGAPRSSDSVALSALGAAVALALAGVWVARRRLLR